MRWWSNSAAESPRILGVTWSSDYKRKRPSILKIYSNHRERIIKLSSNHNPNFSSKWYFSHYLEDLLNIDFKFIHWAGTNSVEFELGSWRCLRFCRNKCYRGFQLSPKATMVSTYNSALDFKCCHFNRFDGPLSTSRAIVRTYVFCLLRISNIIPSVAWS